MKKRTLRWILTRDHASAFKLSQTNLKKKERKKGTGLFFVYLWNVIVKEVST